ncbi:ATP-dependent nuclease [Neolewinella antarctica]|uniref:ATP-dependent endonuclease of OLD family n=1 Tax=Neolewinella antarctica TaxID=442734 RepID=A0ABX0XG31_9BACT|nr:AAA family ATPase [Neolewinella antarctica]NJC28268.1 putative ATP-dependent endonuclease of OLD family [Neolewinella antarctica]
MFISKLFIKNYRSLKEIKIDLFAGKNVFVGKNNSGKSNILKALNILVGERHPGYMKFSDNDFYTKTLTVEGKSVEEIADNIYIEVEISGRNFDEELIKSIRKNTAFSQLGDISDAYERSEDGTIVVNYPLFQSLDDLENRDEISEIELTSKSGNPYTSKTKWASSEEVLNMVKTAKRIKLFFCKSRKQEDFKGYGLLIIDAKGNIWITHYFPKKLRESLVTTTIIGALRNTKSELRLQHYTWFGKLIGKLWNDNKDQVEEQSGSTYENLIKNKSNEIKEYVDVIFHDNTSELRKLLESAIAHKEVSFKFMSDNKYEMYKSIQVFVNDGIDRSVDEKGTGIQSAIIIALFSQYCNQFHNASSLLVVEEPELYLHPQARRVISAELNKFIDSSENQERQLFISTHSVEYLKNVDPQNIIRIYKDSESNCTHTAQLPRDIAADISNEIKRFIWSTNTEMFFADKVVLVEGGEFYLLPVIIDRILKEKQSLDYQNCSIGRVNGKSNFLIYIKMLSAFNIDWILLGDLDCYKGDVSKIISHLDCKELEKSVNDIKETINQGAIDYGSMKKRIGKIERNLDVQDLQNVFQKFKDGSISRDDDSLAKTLSYMEDRYLKINPRNHIDEEGLTNHFNKIQIELRKKNIFIWSHGELEDYYTDAVVQLPGSKDMKALTLSYLISDEEQELNHFLKNIDEVTELVKMITK